MVSNDEVRPYLETVDFPAGRDDIVREAERLGASQPVLRALRAMPPLDYANRDEVLRSAGTDLAPEMTPAERAAKARERTQHRIPLYLRRL